MRLQIAIIPHPTSPTHRVAKVTTARGYVYALTSAEPFPTEAEVRQLWREHRRAFAPYDETTGRYC
jgi:hypothetical protein